MKPPTVHLWVLWHFLKRSVHSGWTWGIVASTPSTPPPITKKGRISTKQFFSALFQATTLEDLSQLQIWVWTTSQGTSVNPPPWPQRSRPSPWCRSAPHGPRGALVVLPSFQGSQVSQKNVEKKRPKTSAFHGEESCRCLERSFNRHHPPMTMKWLVLIELAEAQTCHSTKKTNIAILMPSSTWNSPSATTKTWPNILPASGTKHFLDQVDFAPHQNQCAKKNMRSTVPVPHHRIIM